MKQVNHFWYIFAAKKTYYCSCRKNDVRTFLRSCRKKKRKFFFRLLHDEDPHNCNDDGDDVEDDDDDDDGDDDDDDDDTVCGLQVVAAAPISVAG